MRSSGKSVIVGVVGTLVLVVVATVVRMNAGEDLRDATLSLACWATACSGHGLAFAGWLMIMTLPIFVAGAVWVARRFGRRGKISMVLASCAYFVVAICFLPGERGDLEYMLRGPGGLPFIDGMGWGYGTLALAAGLSIALGALSTKVKWPRQVHIGIVAVAVLGMMTAAIVRAVPAYPPAVFLIGPSTVVGDDTLTRTAVSERDGCDGILADSSPLGGCLHTAEFEVTTSDSDAVTRLSAVMFADSDAAWKSWRELRESTAPAGVEGDTLVLPEVASEWLTIAVVRHADGRQIAEADKPWLRWPAAQLRYVFAQAVNYSIAREPEPDEEAAPKP